MGPKSWPTVSETVTHKGVAAWQWLQVGYPRARALAATQGRDAPGLDAALEELPAAWGSAAAAQPAAWGSAVAAERHR